MTNPFLANNATPTATPEANTQAAPANVAVATPPAANAIANVGQTPGQAADPFAAPRGASGDKISDDLDQGLVVRPSEYIQSMTTTQGVTDAVQADWIVLTGPDQGKVRSGLVFQTVLKKELRAILGTPTPMMVGILVRGVAKGTNSAPFLFAPANDEVRGLAAQAAKANNWI